MTIDTTPRTYPVGKRPRVIIDGWEDQEVYLKRINSKTAYFCGPYYVGELAIEVEKVREIIAPTVTIYAAIIEWPSALEPIDPSLILATSADARSAETIAEIRETADILAEPDWRDALAGIDSSKWSDFTEALENTSYGQPFITEYEREFPA